MDYYIGGLNKQFQDAFPKMFPEYLDLESDEMATKNITFVTNEACNLACTYCYQCDKGQEKFMSKEVAKKAVEALFDKKKMKNYLNEDVHKCVIIEFIGGEPFLNVEVMDYVVEYFRYLAFINNSLWYKNYMINVTTNGTLNHTPEVQRFIDKYKSKLSISITIDGDKELHDSCRVFRDGSGSYDVVYKNVQEAIEKFGLNTTKVTFAPENIDKINRAIPHLFDIGLVDVSANCVFENVWKDEDAPKFYKELVKLADYMIDNKIYKHACCSIFDDTIGTPVPPEDNKNWCFRAGTKVLTPNGNVNIEDLSIGDKVIADDKSMQIVENIMKRKSNNTAILVAEGMFKTFTTDEHPYLVKKIKSKNYYSSSKWMSVKDIKNGDLIALHCHKFGNITMDKNLAFIIGRYIIDGIYHDDEYIIRCNDEEFNILKPIIDLSSIKYDIIDNKSCKYIIISKDNTDIIKIISQLDINIINRKIPKEVFEWDKDSVVYLLKGMVNTDFGPNNINFNTSSSLLANDTVILLRGLGYIPICETYDDDCVVYNIKFNTTKNKLYDENNRIYWSPVKDVVLNCEPYEVYNLTVSNTHTFIANGAVVHNCGGDGQMLAIGTDGTFYPCIRFMKYSLSNKNRKEIILGNVDDGITTSIYNDKVFLELTTITRRSQSTDECFDCPVGRGCAWFEKAHLISNI